MRAVPLARSGERLSILCLGAHADDVEIGAGGAILAWIAGGVRLHAHWCVLSAPGPRAAEARASAAAFLAGAASATVDIATFEDGLFPEQGREIKLWLETLRQRVQPDLILTHRRNDAHQDHRELRRLTWTAFRDHLILEYEIPKWDGDLGRPNVYLPLGAEIMDRKLALLEEHFATQRGKDWFDPETFRGLARLRGAECRAPERYAEAFVASKLRLG